MSSKEFQFRSHRARPRISTGFTLLEVLVALAVIAIALSALVKVSSENTTNMAYMRDKTLAHWVAMNKAAELHVGKVWATTGDSNGVSEMANREWNWNMTISDTPNGNIRKFKIDVRAHVEGLSFDESSALSTLTGYIGKT